MIGLKDMFVMNQPEAFVEILKEENPNDGCLCDALVMYMWSSDEEDKRRKFIVKTLYDFYKRRNGDDVCTEITSKTIVHLLVCDDGTSFVHDIHDEYGDDTKFLDWIYPIIENKLEEEKARVKQILYEG